MAEQLKACVLEYKAPLDVEAVRILAVADEQHGLSKQDVETSQANSVWAQALYDRSLCRVTPFQPEAHEPGA